MSFAGPIVSPAGLDLLANVQMRANNAYAEVYSGEEYSSYKNFTGADDPAGDIIWTFYSEPLAPPALWQGERHMSSVAFDYWTQTVDSYADGFELDVDDLKQDSGNPAKAMMYLMAAQRLGESVAGLWPGLVAHAIAAGTTTIWKPDGQYIFDTHPYSPRNASLGSFRNYNANNVQGGSAAYPLNYANLLALLVKGSTFKAPTGLDYPIRYNVLVVPPGSGQVARRLVGFDRLPVQEVLSTATSAAGGDALNAIKMQFGYLQVYELANMAPGTWLLMDTSKPSEIPLRVKQRQPITWQYVGPGGASWAFPVGADEGMVSEAVFNTNKVKYGPKARGAAYASNWWRMYYCDGNA